MVETTTGTVRVLGRTHHIEEIIPIFSHTLLMREWPDTDLFKKSPRNMNKQ